MAEFTLDPANLPKLTADQASRLDTMTEAEIEAAALADPDNPPLNEDELERLGSAALVKRTRIASGLSQQDFAARYRINYHRLRDLERGRTVADSALQAYLTVILRQRAAVDLALSA